MITPREDDLLKNTYFVVKTKMYSTRFIQSQTKLMHEMIVLNIEKKSFILHSS